MKRNRTQRTPKRNRGKHEVVKARSPRYSSLTPREKSAYQRTASLVSDLRRGEGSYTALLRKYHVSSCTARKYAGRNLLGGAGGKRVRASKSDRLVRELLFPKSSGDVPRQINSSRDATKIASFFQDRDKLLRGKLSIRSFEAKWRGVRVAGQELFADAATILEMADAGELKVETLYASSGGAR